MKTLVKTVQLVLLGSLMQACAIPLYHTQAPEYATDPVCGMKVDKSEAYVYKYEGVKYYFDSYNCKSVFKMSPKSYTTNKCADSK